MTRCFDTLGCSAVTAINKPAPAITPSPRPRAASVPAQTRCTPQRADGDQKAGTAASRLAPRPATSSASAYGTGS